MCQAVCVEATHALFMLVSLNDAHPNLPKANVNNLSQRLYSLTFADKTTSSDGNRLVCKSCFTSRTWCSDIRRAGTAYKSMHIGCRQSWDMNSVITPNINWFWNTAICRNLWSRSTTLVEPSAAFGIHIIPADRILAKSRAERTGLDASMCYACCNICDRSRYIFPSIWILRMYSHIT